MPWRAAAHAVERDAELGAVALERLRPACARAWSRIASRPVRSRGSVGTLWSAVASVRSGPAHLAAGEPQALERLRRGDLVDEVQVDVEQRGPALALGRPHLVRLPDLLEHASWASTLAPPQAGGDHRHELRLAAAGVLEVVRQVGVERDRVALARDRARRRRRRAAAGPASTTAVSRLPASWIGGSPGPPVAAPAASVCSETSARWPGNGRRQHLVAVAVARGRPAGAGRARTTVTPSPSSRRSSWESVSSRPDCDLGGDRQRRAGLAALDLGQHRRRDAGALGQVAQREVHRLAQGPDAGADGGFCDRWRRCSCACTLSHTSVLLSAPFDRELLRAPPGMLVPRRRAGRVRRGPGRCATRLDDRRQGEPLDSPARSAA